MRFTIIITILLISLVTNGQRTIYTPSNTENLGTKYKNIDSNFTDISTYGLTKWNIWNDLSTEHRLSVYANDSLREPRYIYGLVGDIENYWDGVARYYNFIDNSALASRVDGSIWLGDIVGAYSNQTRTQFIEILEDATLKLAINESPVILLLGNHESNSESNGHIDTALSKQDQRDYLLDSLFIKETRKQFNTNGTDSDACYYFVDDSVKKIRSIVLDMYDVPQMLDGSYYRYRQQTNIFYLGAQIQWYADALDLPDSDWRVILYTHTQYSLAATDNSSTSIITITLAFINNTTYSVTGDNADNAYSVSGDFSVDNNFNGVLIGNFHGHGHEQTEKVESGINIIQTPAMRPNSTRVTRITGTSTEDCADFLLIDDNQTHIRLIRYGAGGLNYTGDNINGDRGLDGDINY